VSVLSAANQRVVLLGERDGFACHYCAPLIIDPRDPERDGAVWVPAQVFTHHCGCGMHTPPEPCTIPAYWELPTGWRWGEADHVLARSRGGPDDLENLVLSCAKCNSRKGARPYDEFVASVA
jgi:hypothetical protein